MKLIKLLFLRFIKKLFGSFDVVTKNSFSARKMSAFVGVVTGLYITFFNVKADNAISFLHAWQAFSLLCLGVITIQQLVELSIEKNGKA
jgi:hypothetical protein